MLGHIEKSGTSIQSGIGQSYDSKYKLMVIKYAEKKCNTARKLIFVEVKLRGWRQQKLRLKKHGHFQDLEAEIVKFVHLNRDTVVPITCETINYKAWELAKSHITQHNFKDSTGWYVHMMWRNRFSLHRRTSLCRKLPADFEEKLVPFR
jgi:hypothetical protein